MKNICNVIKAKIENYGYKAEIKTIIKNGQEVTGISLGEGSVTPIIYPDKAFLSGKTVDEIVAEAIELLNNVNSVSYADMQHYFSWEYAKNNLILCIQKKSNDAADILKKDFLDLELYVRVKISGNGWSAEDDFSSYKVKSGMFEVDEAEIFNRAFEQTRKNFVVKNMKDITDLYANEVLKSSLCVPEMLIITDRYCLYGAIALYNTELLHKIASVYGSNLVIVLSSIHECIIIIDNEPDPSDYDEIVQVINRTRVAPEEQLSDHVYIYDRSSGKIRY